jgi:hypothetical protein
MKKVHLSDNFYYILLKDTVLSLSTTILNIDNYILKSVSPQLYYG